MSASKAKSNDELNEFDKVESEATIYFQTHEKGKIPIKYVNTLSFIEYVKMCDINNNETCQRIIETYPYMDNNMFLFELYKFMSIEDLSNIITDDLMLPTEHLSILEVSKSKTDADFWFGIYKNKGLIDDIMRKRAMDAYLFSTIVLTSYIPYYYSEFTAKTHVHKYNDNLESLLKLMKITHTITYDDQIEGNEETYLTFDYDFGCYAELDESTINIMCDQWIGIDIENIAYIYFILNKN